MTYAATTTVPAEKTRIEIEKVIEKYGAKAFMYSNEPGKAFIQFFCHERLVRMVLPLPSTDEFKYPVGRDGKPNKWNPNTEIRQSNLFAQAVRTRWRCLLLTVKSKLESVESGIETFEQAFLANIVTSDGRVIGEVMRPQIAEMYSKGSVQLLLEAPQ